MYRNPNDREGPFFIFQLSSANPLSIQPWSLLTFLDGKPEFGPGTVEATNVKMENVEKPYFVEEGSTIEVDGVAVSSS